MIFFYHFLQFLVMDLFKFCLLEALSAINRALFLRVIYMGFLGKLSPSLVLYDFKMSFLFYIAILTLAAVHNLLQH
jgi:hypothetical protein